MRTVLLSSTISFSENDFNKYNPIFTLKHCKPWKGSEVKCWPFILFQCSESTVHDWYPSTWTAMFLNEDTLEQIRFYLCKLCLWINCRIIETSWSLHEYCGRLQCIIFSAISLKVMFLLLSQASSRLQTPITLQYWWNTLGRPWSALKFFFGGKGEANSKLNIWDASLSAVHLPLNPYSNRLSRF